MTFGKALKSEFMFRVWRPLVDRWALFGAVAIIAFLFGVLAGR